MQTEMNISNRIIKRLQVTLHNRHGCEQPVTQKAYLAVLNGKRKYSYYNVLTQDVDQT